MTQIFQREPDDDRLLGRVGAEEPDCYPGGYTGRGAVLADRASTPSSHPMPGSPGWRLPPPSGGTEGGRTATNRSPKGGVT